MKSASICLILATPLWAETVSINFPGNAGADGTVAPNDTAGVVESPNWNNITQPATALVDSSGNATPITIAFTVGGWSNNLIENTTPNHRLMTGYLDIGGTTAATVTLNQLDPSKTYRIYIYSDGENTNQNAPVSRTGTFTVGSTATGITDTAGEQFEGTFKRVFPGTTGEGNYSEFTVTGAASYSIVARATAADGVDNVFRAPINAIQIVESPE